MNDHLSSVGNPAPPRPRSPEAFTSSISASRDLPSAFARTRRRSTATARPSPWDGWDAGSPLRVPLEQPGDRFGRDALDEIVVDEDRRREAARAEALDLDHGEAA